MIPLTPLPGIVHPGEQLKKKVISSQLQMVKKSQAMRRVAQKKYPIHTMQAGT